MRQFGITDLGKIYCKEQPTFPQIYSFLGSFQFAVTYDYQPNKKKKVGILISGLINLVYVLFRIIGGIIVGDAIRGILRINFGEYGYFSIGELLLIANSLMGTVYLYLNHKHYTKNVRPFLYFSTVLFLIGAGVANAGNHEILLEIIPMHALWHSIAGFGFILIWVFNEFRFKSQEKLKDSTLKKKDAIYKFWDIYSSNFFLI